MDYRNAYLGYRFWVCRNLAINNQMRLFVKKVLAALLFAASAPVFADSYSVTFGWPDPTTYLPSDAPVYSAKYRVNGGAETVIPGLATPGGSVNVTAAPGQAIEIAARNCNLSLCSAWSAWATATAPHPATQPQNPGAITITVTRTGP